MHTRCSSVILASGLVFVFLAPLKLAATDYTSDSFILRDPVITVEGGRSTSTSFELFTSSGQTDIGESTSTTFTQRAGFLYFPFASSPVVSATAGDSQVSLTWTASSVALGFTVSGYEVAQSTTSGGAYAYAAVGNVLASTRTGLTNGTAYYFVVRALDSFGDGIATSTEVTATPTAGSASTTSGSSGGGRGGGSSLPRPSAGTVVLSGTAYPNSPVTILKDGQPAVTVIAGADARFSATLGNLTPGSYLFAVYSEDHDGQRSDFVTVEATLQPRETVTIGGIFLPPTIRVDKPEVKRGEAARFSGQSAPGAEVVLSGSGDSFVVGVRTDASGRYQYDLDTNRVARGTYLVQAKATRGGESSAFNRGVRLIVGDRTIPAPPPERCALPPDFNHDCRVNIVDFSILVYWFYRQPPPATVDLSHDGRVNLTDFSILVYYWTG